MESIELRIDVSGAVPLPGPLHIAASVFLPDPAKLSSPPVAINRLAFGERFRRYRLGRERFTAGCKELGEAVEHFLQGVGPDSLLELDGRIEAMELGVGKF